MLAVSELAGNLVEYAQHGQIVLALLDDADRRGLQVVSSDSGPGIPNIEQAMTDGFSTRHSLGFGLGTAHRMMDDFDIQSNSTDGTIITCKRWLPVNNPMMGTCPLECGAATHAHPQMDVNGDAFVVKQWGERALVAVIDGVGHGPPANQASQAARQYIENHYEQPLPTLFKNVDYTCRATRGVVIGLAQFDCAQSRLSFAGIGNIEARLFEGKKSTNLMMRRGVVGYNAPKPIILEHPWEPHSMLIMHSDGVKSSWQMDDFPDLFGKTAPIMAQRLLHALNRGDDDATVVVVRGGL